MFDTLKVVWERVGKPVFEFIGKVIKGLVDIITGIVSAVQTAFTNVWNGVRSVYDQQPGPDHHDHR